MSTLEERIAERTRIRDKALEKANQCSEQIKRLEKQQAEKSRKERTHALIVCGAELVKLFGKVLTEEEILRVVVFLEAKMKSGEFSLSQTEPQEKQEQKNEISESERIWHEFWG